MQSRPPHSQSVLALLAVIWLPVAAQSGFDDDRVMLQGFYWESYRHGHPKFPTSATRSGTTSSASRRPPSATGRFDLVWLPPPSYAGDAQRRLQPEGYLKLDNSYGTFAAASRDARGAAAERRRAGRRHRHQPPRRRHRAGPTSRIRTGAPGRSRATTRRSPIRLGGRTARPTNAVPRRSARTRTRARRHHLPIRLLPRHRPHQRAGAARRHPLPVAAQERRLSRLALRHGARLPRELDRRVQPAPAPPSPSANTTGASTATARLDLAHGDEPGELEDPSNVFDFSHAVHPQGQQGQLRGLVRLRQRRRHGGRHHRRPAVEARAVTFLENHDTGYRTDEDGTPQKHHESDSFPNNWEVEQGYAHILTHPGVPSVYWKHYFDWGSDLTNKIAR